MALLPSSSSSFFTYRFSYQVFLSFRGTNTRYGFTGYLYKALDDKGICTFTDEEELQKGEEITPSLLKAIEGSRIAIIVLSKNYASSSFCLDELSKILDCINEKGRLVWPVFYNVDPSDVRRLNGSFGEAMTKHEERFKDDKEKLEKWKMALQKVANLSGWHVKHGNDTYEHEFVTNIVEEVSKKIKRVALPIADYPVGLESPILNVIKLLDVGSSDDRCHMVGIYGIGGIGKTALALAVYNSVADHFEGVCFLENVRETSQKDGLMHIQKTILSEIVGEKEIQLTSVKQGSSIIQQRLQKKKVLLILDDVDNRKQLEAIAGSPEWFGLGSRVIITTRDKQLLACHQVESIYEVEELNKEDALELLKWKAFKTNEVDPSYVDIFNDVVGYASGLPLALEVIGSHLCGKSIEEWKSALDQYKRIPNDEIQQILQVSFIALGEEERSVFLDIACCLKGYGLVKVEEILCAHYGGCMKHHIGVLVDKSLIKTHWYRVDMHDLIEYMGKDIVRKESLKHPGKRSRLWSPTDIVEVLEENTGTAEIEMICLNFSLSGEVEWDGEAFKQMKKLKTLIIKYGHFSKGPKYLPNSLKVLEWRSYPSHVLPSDFHPKKLTICKLPENCLTLSELPSSFKNVTILSFDRCEYLTTIPDVSGLQNIEKISFEGCKNLITIHDSVGLLDKLKVLNAEDCSMLGNVPPLKLTSLESLHLSGCKSLVSFPEILVEMKNISELELYDINIKEFPFSFCNLSRLQSLSFRDFGTSFQLPSSIYMMSKLVEISFKNDRSNLRGVIPLIKEDEGEEKVSSMLSSNLQRLRIRQPWSNNLLDEFLAICLQCFAKIKELNLSESDITIIPECIKECHFLWKLNLYGCNRLQEIRGIPPNLKYLSAKRCYSLSALSRSMLLKKEVHEAGDTYFHLSSPKQGRIPEWFEHQKMGLSTSFSFRNKFPHIALCLAQRSEGFHSALVDDMSGFRVDVIINDKKFKCLHCYSDDTLFNSYLFHMVTVDEALLENERSHANNQFSFLKRFDEDYVSKEECRNMKGRVLMGEYDHNIDEALSQNDWNHVKIKVTMEDPRLIFMEIGIHVLEEKNSMEDICFPDHKDNIETVDQLSSILFMGTELNAAKGKEVEERLRSMLSSNFEYLDLSGCHLSDQCFPMGLLGFPNLKELNLSKNDITFVPNCFKEFHFLWKLQLDYCEKLEDIKGIPPSLRYLSAKGCKSLDNMYFSFSIELLLNQELHEGRNTEFYLASPIYTEKITEWFEHRRMGLSTSFWFRNKFPHIALCLDHFCGNKSGFFDVVVIINGKQFPCMKQFPSDEVRHIYLFHMLTVDEALLENECSHANNEFPFLTRNGVPLSKEECTSIKGRVLMGENHHNLDEVLLQNEWNHVEIKIISDVLIFMEIGVHVFKENNSMEDICLSYHMWNLNNIETVDQLSSIIFMGAELNADIDIDEVEERLRSMLSSNFEYLDLSGCHLSDQCFPIRLLGFPNLKELNLSKNDFTFVPNCFKEFHFLWKLELDYCEKLEHIFEIPPSLRYLSTKGCRYLSNKSIDELLKQKLHDAGTIPEWFEHQKMGQSTSFSFCSKFPHIALSLASYSCCVSGNFNVDVIINDEKFVCLHSFTWVNEKCHTYLFHMVTVDEALLENERSHANNQFPFLIKLFDEYPHCKLIPLSKEECTDMKGRVLMGEYDHNIDEALSQNDWNHVEIKVSSDEWEIFMEIGIHVLEEKNSMEDICFPDHNI